MEVSECRAMRTKPRSVSSFSAFRHVQPAVASSASERVAVVQSLQPSRPGTTRLAGGSRRAAVLGPSVGRRIRRVGPVRPSQQTVGGGDDVLAARPVVVRRSEACQQTHARIVERPGDVLVRGPVEFRPQRRSGPGSQDAVGRHLERVMQASAGEDHPGVPRVWTWSEVKLAVPSRVPRFTARLASPRHGRQPRAVDRGAEQAARVPHRARQAFCRIGVPKVSGTAQAEHVDLHLQQVGDVERA